MATAWRFIMSSSALLSPVPTLSRPNGWIISPVCDVAFFLAPPLIALLIIAAFDFSDLASTQLPLMLLAVVAGGHQIPGFIRAYSDSDIMRRYRWRLVLAPILLIAAAVYCEFWQIAGMQIILIFWGVWHVVMQNYGLLRIYGAKAGDTAATSASLDWLIMVSWVFSSYLNNPNWSYRLQWYVYEMGCPLLPADAFPILGTVCFGTATGLSLIYVINEIRQRHQRSRYSPIRYILLVESILFFVLSFSITNSILIATVLVELVHDLQYYAIGWAFQVKLAQKQGTERPLLRELFRPALMPVVCYVSICMIYGILISDFGRTYLYPEGSLFQLARALATAAAIFHFYSDGFIWKVRQARTRECLGIHETRVRNANAAERPEPIVWKRSALHFFCFASIFSLMLATQYHRSDRSLLVAEHLVRQFPQLGTAHHTLGLEYQKREEHSIAIRELLIALDLGVPESIELRQRIAISFESLGEYNQAVSLLQEAVAKAPVEKVQQAAAQLALMYAECPDANIRNGAEAVRLAELAVPRTGAKRPLYLDILAASYQAAGRQVEARKTAILALNEARYWRQQAFVERISGRLLQLENRPAESSVQ